MASGGEGAGSGESPPAGAEEAASVGATLNIRCANGSKFTVRADLAATVGAFKEVVAGSCDVPAPQQRLIYKGRILKDEQTLESYGACHAESTVLLESNSSRFSLVRGDWSVRRVNSAVGVVNSVWFGLLAKCLFMFVVY
jgi:ubiquilin